MSLISFYEMILVLSTAVVIIAYHTHLYIKIRRNPLTTAIGMRGFYLSVPLALWLFGPVWMLAGSLILVSVLYRLDREA